MWLHVEPTTRCNAHCPGCARNNEGYGVADGLVIEDLDPARLAAVIREYSISSVQLCGNLGDPCAAKNIDLLLDSLDTITTLQIHTNGSLRKPEWWAGLVDRFRHLQQFDVWFALDGTGDVHSYYRQGTSYERTIENARAFIDAGGRAVWQFIPFAHNEHQITECIKLSQRLGFKRFEFVRNANYEPRSRHYRTGLPLDIRPWSQNDRFNARDKRGNSVAVRACMHLNIPSIFLSANGVVAPCCYMANTPVTEVDIRAEFASGAYRPICTRSCG